MTAANYDLTVEAGATWNLILTLKNDAVAVDLSNYTARMMVRPYASSPVLFISLTSAALGGITLGGVAGTITIDRTATQTATYKFASGVYDIEIQSAGGTVTRIMEGVFTVSPEVTR